MNYTNDDPDSYSAIWDGAVAKAGKADRKRVVKALKNVSEGTELEKYMDIDNLLRYMAVHVFSVNSDSLTGMMAHNYYLYEKDGRLNMLPWDYNLALGGMMGGGNASGTVNDAIDGAFTGTKFFDTLMEDEKYYSQYHDYLRQLVDGYINGGAFDEFYARTRGILDELVKTDPTAFYTFEEYTDAAETLYEVVKLRGQSISGQLDGRIPSTESGQRQNSGNLIDTGNLDLSVMGSMDMGNGAMGGGRGPGGKKPEGFDPSQFGGDMPEGFDPSQFGGDMPEGFDPSQFGGGIPEGFEPPQFGGQNEMPTGEQPQFDKQDEAQAEEQTTEAGRPERGKKDFGGFPGGGPGGDPNGSPNAAMTKNLINYGISFAVMAVAFVFVMRFQRKSRRK